MPVELKILAYAALVQVVQFALMAVPVNLQMGPAYTGGNRDEPRAPTGVPGRLKRAMDNHFEGLILFSIAVIVLVAADISTPLTRACAWAYLVARILYVPAYVIGVFGVRSLIWSVGFAATVVMLIVAVTRPAPAQADSLTLRGTATAGAAGLLPDAVLAANMLGMQLKTELQSAMKASGPAGAIAVCQERAPALAKQISEDTGFRVTRVSSRPRNPVMGPPTEWQRSVLETFAERQRAGENPAGFTWHEVKDGEFRFMKAIPTAGVCLACHGTELSEDVQTALAARYPNDMATGYSAGEIRGAFVVTRDWVEPQPPVLDQ